MRFVSFSLAVLEPRQPRLAGSTSQDDAGLVYRGEISLVYCSEISLVLAALEPREPRFFFFISREHQPRRCRAPGRTRAAHAHHRSLLLHSI